MVLFRMMPVPPATTMEPNVVLMLVVQATAFPSAVDHRKMRRPAVAAGDEIAIELRRERGWRTLQSAQAQAAGRREQSREREVNEIRVAVQSGSVGEGELHGLGEEMEIVARLWSERRQVVAAKLVHDGQDHASP